MRVMMRSFLVLAIGALIVPAGALAEHQEGHEFTTICHATGSTADPYDRLDLDPDGVAVHRGHPNDIIPATAGTCRVEIANPEANIGSKPGQPAAVVDSPTAVLGAAAGPDGAAAVAASGASLPFTGAETWLLGFAGAMSFALGLALHLRSRRPVRVTSR